MKCSEISNSAHLKDYEVICSLVSTNAYHKDCQVKCSVFSNSAYRKKCKWNVLYFLTVPIEKNVSEMFYIFQQCLSQSLQMCCTGLDRMVLSYVSEIKNVLYAIMHIYGKNMAKNSRYPTM